MEEITAGPTPETNPKRPVLLTILCILTFVGGGLNLVSSFLICLFYNAFQAIAGDISKSFDLPSMDMILNAKPAFFLVSSFFYAFSVFGAFEMWKLRKRGFHLYTISQILLVMMPMYFFGLSVPSYPDIIFSGIFILLYSVNLKHMS
jgi:hypothetical protein